MKACLHAVVSGKVQGVFFRQATREKAIALNLTGWVCNLPSRQVELLACGNQADLEQFLLWLHQGPLLAKVSEVQHEFQEWQPHSQFEILAQRPDYL